MAKIVQKDELTPNTPQSRTYSTLDYFIVLVTVRHVPISPYPDDVDHCI